MTKNDMISYMRKELKELKNKMDSVNNEYNKTDNMGKIGLSIRKEIAEELYYHFWTVCNNMGIIDIYNENL